MIQTFALACIRQAAEAAGVPADRVMTLSAKDTLIIPRPRIEYQILPARYRRTGRKLGIKRGTPANPIQTIKRELYAIDLDLSLNVLAPDTKKDPDAAEAWLSAFAQAFTVALPKGGNDAAGNWVGVSIQRVTQSRQPDKRITEKAVRVSTFASSLFFLTFSGRITTEEQEALLTDVTINLPPMSGKGA